MEEMYTCMKWEARPNSICYGEGGGYLKKFLSWMKDQWLYVFLRLEIKDQTNPKQNHKEIF